ncbi:MAG: hypothetical protein KDA96_22240 [Planctomycetaceae bacterium]|nr:hypothetical protein [Planctomycetaceae bacterium]
MIESKENSTLVDDQQQQSNCTISSATGRPGKRKTRRFTVTASPMPRGDPQFPGQIADEL